jgi:hypothetical protein
MKQGQGDGALKDAQSITTSLTRAQLQLEASLAQAEATAGSLDDDGNTIKVSFPPPPPLPPPFRCITLPIFILLIWMM